MRRKDREITDYRQMLRILEGCDCCRIGLADAGETYIVPLSFGYEEEGGRLVLYFHSAAEGRKTGLLKKQPAVSFEMDRKHELAPGSTACQYSFRYQSIMGRGTAQILESREDKTHGLQRIMLHYTGKSDWQFEEQQVSRVSVIRLEVAEWSCKEH